MIYDSSLNLNQSIFFQNRGNYVFCTAIFAKMCVYFHQHSLRNYRMVSCRIGSVVYGRVD